VKTSRDGAVDQTITRTRDFRVTPRRTNGASFWRGSPASPGSRFHAQARAAPLDFGGCALTYRFMLELKEKPRAHAPPAKAWRNYYKVYRVLTLFRAGTLFPGIHPGPDVFPSKEIAEQHALVFLKAINLNARPIMDFAGSFPEGERAN
jgi:hypothetical protein